MNIDDREYVRRRESSSGFHFWNTFNDCKAEFYFAYYLGWRPKYIEPPLALGGAFHDGKAIFYETGSEAKALTEFRDSMSTMAAEFEYEDSYRKTLKRGLTMLRLWIAEVGVKDLQNYKIVSVERELKARLPNGFLITGRPDAVVEDRKKFRYILETKTGSFSITLTDTNVQVGDQSTTYIYLFKRNFPKARFAGLIPDIAYWNKESQKIESIRFPRTEIVLRSEWELAAFELYTMDTLIDIAQRVQAADTGKYPHAQLFGRNTDWCFSYHRVCPYLEICRTRVDPAKCPPGFKLSKWVERPAVQKLIKETRHGKKTSKTKAPVAGARKVPRGSTKRPVRRDRRLRHPPKNRRGRTGGAKK